MSTAYDLSGHPDDHPYNRMRRLGFDALSDAEVLSLAVGGGREIGAGIPVALHLLAAHDGVRGLARASFGHLAHDLGERRAARLLAAFELSRRARATPLPPRLACPSSADIVRAYGPRLRDAVEERVEALVLDARQCVVAARTLAHGPTCTVALGMREVFALVVREGGEGVVVLHNHPSGDPRPSEADVRFTRGLWEAARSLDMELVDHIVVARDGYFSFRDSGLLRSLSPAEGPR